MYMQKMKIRHREMQGQEKVGAWKAKPLLSKSDGYGDAVDRRRVYQTSEYLCVILTRLEKKNIAIPFGQTCQESENVDLEDGRTTVFLILCGKNESEVNPGELVAFLQYMKEKYEGSEKEFHNPYVGAVAEIYCKVKENREDGGTLYDFWRC